MSAEQRAVLLRASAQFRMYAQEHAAKGGTQKAMANVCWSVLCAETAKLPSVQVFPAPRPRVRSQTSDRMGFAWERDELPDMTVGEAANILLASTPGHLGNEYEFTLDHARNLVNDAFLAFSIPRKD